MKRISLFLICAAITLFCVGCGKEPGQRTADADAKSPKQKQQKEPMTVTNAKSSRPAPSPHRDVLAKATIFGFGVRRGQKPTARPTDGAFKALLATPDAKEQFSAVFELDNLYSKLYALCALHRLDKELFQKLSGEIKKTETVRKRNGCMVSNTTVGEIIEEIENGQYDFMFKGIAKKETGKFER